MKCEALFHNLFKINSIKHEHSCKILYIKRIQYLLHICEASLYIHAQLSGGTRGLNFGQSIPLLPNFAGVRSKLFPCSAFFHAFVVLR